MNSEHRLFSLPEEILSSELFKAALTHRSVGKKNNERLEFLGDSILGFVIAQLLFEKFPNHDEGDLSRLRAHLVCKPTLAELAKQAKINEHINLGAGERKSGGHNRASILADSLEAVIGAIYLIKGFDYTKEFITKIYANQFEILPTAQELKDPKTRLQEVLQARQLNVPIYKVIAERGIANNKWFTVECQIEKLSLQSTGEEKSKKKAEQIAAKNMIDLIDE